MNIDLEQDIHALYSGPQQAGLLEYLHEHRQRFQDELKILKHHHEEGRILEVGSVPCFFTSFAKELGYNVTGIDLDPTRGHNLIKKYGLDIKKCDIEKEKFPFESNTFSTVLFLETFEHLPINPLFTLNEIVRVLKNNGILILSTPNLYSIGNIIRFLIGNSFNDAIKELEKINLLGHSGHIREYSKKEMLNLIKKMKLILIKHQFSDYGTKKDIVSRIKRLVYKVLPFLSPYQVLILKKTI